MDIHDNRDKPRLEKEAVQVRRLRPADLEAVIALDARNTGRRREEYFKVKLNQAISEVGMEISLAAEFEGCFAGYLIARVYYGEFGSMEQMAMLDSIGVHPDFTGLRIGHELMRQLRTNLLALGVGTLSTEASWDDTRLLGFFQRERFRPATRLCLDLDLEEARRTEHTLVT
jgi:ribosomal protein S18 acetylase RimI-like enzyme